VGTKQSLIIKESGETGIINLEMTFAAILYFDSETERILNGLESDLQSQGIQSFPRAIRTRPHITLAGFEPPLPSRLIEALKVFASQNPAQPVHLAAAGAFPSDQGVVFLSPVVTSSLLELHARFHTLLSNFSLQRNPYYLPGAWMPHCTIAAELHPDHLPQVLQACQTAGVYRSGKLVELGLVNFPPVEEIAAFPFSR
jgi:2'-5' RNA ligase